MEGLAPILYGILGILLFVVGIPAVVWLAVVVRNRLLAKETISKLSYVLGGMATVIMPMLLIEAAIFLQALFAFGGTCYGFTDGSWPCSRVDFMLMQASYGVFILIPFTAISVPTIMAVFIFGWRRRLTIGPS